MPIESDQLKATTKQACKREPNGDRALVAHVTGGRALTKQYPANRLRWEVKYAIIPDGLPLQGNDAADLYDQACRAGRPLTREETRVFLLARRLAA